MTQAMTRVPAHGPSRTAARTPPSRWPDVPPTTWKLNIWAAKMNAAVTPSSGTARSSSVRFVRRTAIARTTTVIRPHRGRDGQRQEPVGGVHLGRGRQRAGRGDDGGGEHPILCGGDVGNGRRWPSLPQQHAIEQRRYTFARCLRLDQSSNPRPRRSAITCGRAACAGRRSAGSCSTSWPRRTATSRAPSSSIGAAQVDPGTTPSTVYRTLRVLEELGVVRHAHGRDGREEFHVRPGSDHGHLHCAHCGASWEIDPVDAKATVHSFDARFGFEIDLSHLTVVGRCADCRRGERA